MINSVMRGQTALIESHGKAEVAIIDIEDYLILRAVMRYHARPPHVDVEAGLSAAAVETAGDLQARYDLVLAHYLAGSISLARAAELLDLPAFDLRTRFVRLDVPLRLGPATVEDALAEVEALHRLGGSSGHTTAEQVPPHPYLTSSQATSSILAYIEALTPMPLKEID